MTTNVLSDAKNRIAESPNTSSQPSPSDSTVQPVNDSASEKPNQPELPNFAPVSYLLPTSQRTGKIAALPPEIRDHVNQMLRGDSSYSDIAHRLGTWGYSGISPANISNWKYGGFADWLRQQQQTEARLALPQALERAAGSVNLDRVQQNAILSACNHLSIILAKFDPERALALLYQRPQLLPAFIGTLAALVRCTRDLTKAFELVHQREIAIHKELKNTAQPAPVSNGHSAANGNGKSHLGEHPESSEPPLNLPARFNLF